MKGTHCQRFGATAEQALEPLAHLARRLVREGDGDDIPGRHAARKDQVGDAMNDDARLARTRPGDEEKWSLGGLHGLELRWVQAYEMRSWRMRYELGHR